VILINIRKFTVSFNQIKNRVRNIKMFKQEWSQFRFLFKEGHTLF